MTHALHLLPWLQSSWLQLESYINQKRIPQALLMVGKKGVGKKQLANYFSQSLLCTSRQNTGAPCGSCHSCILFKAQTHPDYIFITPDEPGKAIGIDIIRQLTTKLALKPQFESYRVVLINTADCLNSASANAFLKYLEEPTERTSLILITDKPSKLPATIRSRCQKLHVTVDNESLARSWLNQQGVTENIDLLFKMSQGAPILAKQLANDSAINFRCESFKLWLKVINSEESFISIAEKWSKLDKNAMELLLFWLISWTIDIVKLKSGSHTNEIVNDDLGADLKQLSDKLDLKKLYQYYDLLLLSQQRLATQLNKQLIFEETLIHCSELNSG